MLLGASIVQDPGPVLNGKGVVLRGATMADYPAWARIRSQSRDHLSPWEPQWTLDELTRSAFRRRIRHYAREARDDHGYGFLIFADGDEMVGGLTLSNLRRGATQSVTMGYWLGAQYTGSGFMSAAVAAVIPFAFDGLRLHRIDAAVMPSNTASIRVLERTGFKQEGLARRYLRINGRWEDHLLYAILADEAAGGGGGSSATGGGGL